jgi:hypothetical protein
MPWLDCDSFKFEIFEWYAGAKNTLKVVVTAPAPNDNTEYTLEVINSGLSGGTKSNVPVAKKMLDALAKDWPGQAFQFLPDANDKISDVRRVPPPPAPPPP